ncbi:MAG: hypothetical protein EOO38_15795 [Cytophagaceae bacterium]|nr:MAG: hypothetical protein EOO38_15795 [Cytophagaceae bacterium]
MSTIRNEAEPYKLQTITQVKPAMLDLNGGSSAGTPIYFLPALISAPARVSSQRPAAVRDWLIVSGFMPQYWIGYTSVNLQPTRNRPSHLKTSEAKQNIQNSMDCKVIAALGALQT